MQSQFKIKIMWDIVYDSEFHVYNTAWSSWIISIMWTFQPTLVYRMKYINLEKDLNKTHR